MLDTLGRFMVANPATSHALTALPETAGVAAAMILMRVPRPEATAALVVSTYYFGREAGQREHAIKHAGWDAVQAHLGAEFLYGWSLANLQQWLAPTCAAWAIAAAIVLIRRKMASGRRPAAQSGGGCRAGRFVRLR